MGIEKNISLKQNTYIVLVNYRNPNVTVDCIESLKKTGIPLEHIVVVDNNSPDNSLDVLSSVKGITLISSEVNGGFSYGNNLGIKYAMEHNCSSVILLNNDTVVEKDFFAQIFHGDGYSVNVPKIYYYSNPDILWYAGGKIDFKRGRQVHFGENVKDGDEFFKEQDVDYASGCCMMIPRKVLEKVGLLAEEYFMYWEDMDYSLRLKEAGIKIHYLPNAKVWHKVGMSGGSESEMAIYYSNRNRFFLMNKYKFSKTAWLYTMSTRLIKYVFSLFSRSNNRVILRAWKDYRNGNMGKADI